ncbi:hypothetical protein [Vibrio hippocampi]|uniref:Lipoprotein n=1 Tax=Vibrio hippocampi TaxID=654686 RepID=A0ABM8ZG96_9VIBR|nr:hypothetical protein [Vibrio hippocampi]CAH0524459.1 hypothetical protein VHP8226_00286 [Vibrio hippocampi]
MKKSKINPTLLLIIPLLMFTLVIHSCFDEPNETISDKLLVMNDNDAKQLLLEKTTVLHQWFVKQSRKDNATDRYVFANALYQDLYRHPYRHLRYTKELLVDDSVDLEVKKLLIKVSQCLSFEDYLSLGDLIFDGGDSSLMYVFTFPGPEYGLVIVDNYRDSSVIELLNVIVIKYPELASSIELIQSGSSYRKAKAYRNSGEAYPVLKCSD